MTQGLTNTNKAEQGAHSGSGIGNHKNKTATSKKCVQARRRTN